jgi:hypothetical protein
MFSTGDDVSIAVLCKDITSYIVNKCLVVLVISTALCEAHKVPTLEDLLVCWYVNEKRLRNSVVMALPPWLECLIDNWRCCLEHTCRSHGLLVCPIGLSMFSVVC